MYTQEAQEILGVSSDAQPEEIKAAYRRLAKRYHPDVNPAAEALHHFQQIREAYELLMNRRTGMYATPVHEEVFVDPKQQWREEMKARRAAQEREKARRHLEALQKLYKGLDYLVGIYLFILSVLIIDYLLPVQQHHEQVTEISKVYESSSGSRYSRGRTQYRYDKIYFTNFVLLVDRIGGKVSATEAVVYATPVLRIIVGARVQIQGEFRDLEPVYGLYHRFWVLILLAFGLGCAYFRLSRQGESRLSTGLVMLFIGCMQVVLYMLAY